MKRCKRLFLSAALAGFVFPAAADVFDSSTLTLADSSNYRPWADNRITRYQLWFSQSSLNGYSGILNSITHFASEDLDNLGTSSYTLNIYASTTPVTLNGLQATNLDLNHGTDKTLIFSGSITSAATLTIDVDNVFHYDHSGSLLVDYQFTSFSGVGVFDGPAYQSNFQGSTNIVRVFSVTGEGSFVFRLQALRTQLEFVPEPGGVALAGVAAGLFAVRARDRRKRLADRN
jgi:hypothetical protein